MIFTAFLILFIFINFRLILKSRLSILGNEVYWLSAFWIMCIGTYVTSGINYAGYGLSFYSVSFLILCISVFIIGRRKGLNCKVRIFSPNLPKSIVSYKALSIGLLGAFLYILDYLRLNNLAFLLFDTGGKQNVELSILGTIGCLMMPLLLVQGLSLFVESLVKKNSFSLKAIGILLLYTLPATLQGGRESILFILIGIISLYGYRATLKQKGKLHVVRKEKVRKLWNYIILVIVVSFLGVSIYIISTVRFSEGNINYFLNVNDVPEDVIVQGEKLGAVSFLYFNFLSYFSHQIPFLDLTLQEYSGPYLLGMYELNIISRRLPDFLGLDYNLVFKSTNTMLVQNDATMLSSTWNTVLGSFICDFGRFGAIIMCYIIGSILGRIRKKMINSYDMRYAVLVALLCLSAFSTIQLGPFFQTSIWSTYLWWYILCHRKETVIIS